MRMIPILLLIGPLFFLYICDSLVVVNSWVIRPVVVLDSVLSHQQHRRYGVDRSRNSKERIRSSGRGDDESLVVMSSTSTAVNENIDNRSSARLTANALVRNGMNAFRAGQVEESIRLFNQAEAVQGPSLTPYLWQRGLSYYYANDFTAASRQFRMDVRVNPTDVEEIVWDIASQLRSSTARDNDSSSSSSSTVVFPIPNQLSLPPGRTDGRKIMSTVYRLFRGEGSEHELAQAGYDAGVGSSDEFYAIYYLGLYCEARGVMTKAEAYLRQATSTRYAQQSGDYMAACAKVHCQLRKWT